jgi:hypothetical protein
MIEAKVILDSQYDGGPRLTTFVIKFHRFILPEFNTHRVFSKNTSSSRAIPVQKMIERVKNDPAMPLKFGKNKKGMSASDYLEGEELERAKEIWLKARDNAVESALNLVNLGVHKQTVNRLLEFATWTEMIVTGTDFANFYTLRIHPDAQPEMQELATKMYEAQAASTPQVLNKCDWHLPFILPSDIEAAKYYPSNDVYLLQKISAARCARVSYLKHDGTNPSIEDDLALFDKLVQNKIAHMSPLEHQAEVPYTSVSKPLYRSNLRGWFQFRKFFPQENHIEYKDISDE